MEAGGWVYKSIAAGKPSNGKSSHFEAQIAMPTANIASLGILLNPWARDATTQHGPADTPVSRGASYSRNWKAALAEPTLAADAIDNVEMQSRNPLKSYFNAHAEGRGI